MKLEHSFTVPTSLDEAWKILLDIERIGPCMPGAAVESVDGDDFTGTVKVKLGPIGLTYKGKASFVEKDESAHRAVIDARGRDARGNGTASAKVTATLSAQGDATHVQVDTDLDITGKPAQFGRGVMVDVGNRLIGQFADNLAAEIQGPAEAPAAEPAPAAATDADAAKDPATEGAATAGPAGGDGTAGAGAESTGAAGGTSAPAPNGSSAASVGPRKIVPPREVEPINLIESAGPAVAKRLAPVVVGLLVLLFVWRKRRS